MRGFVVDASEGEGSGLKEIRGVSGDLPVFSPRLLDGLRWAAFHYVAPLAVLLSRAAPPNLPRRGPFPAYPPSPPGDAAGPESRSVEYLLAADRWEQHIIDASRPILAAERSVVVVAPTGPEAASLGKHLTAVFGERVVVVTPDLGAAVTTGAWAQAATRPGTLVVGTARVAFWPVSQVGLAVVMEEGRRGLKDRQTPTVHARDLLRRRARLERFRLLFIGRMPTTDVLGAGTRVVRAAGRRRLWQLVEIVDRTEEPPGSGVLTGRVGAALRGAAARGERAFLFSHRHGYAPAFACASCGTLRRCPACGARPDPGEVCARCGRSLGGCATCGGRRFRALGAGTGRIRAEASRIVGEARVGGPEDGRPVVVGTERDLVGVGSVDLAVAVDADGLILGANYRAAEDALRILIRLASIIPPGRGKRLMVQTSQPHHPVLEALRRGDPLPFLEREVAERRRLGFPPAGELIVVGVVGDPDTADAMLRRAAGTDAAIFGPAASGPGRRWLLQGADLEPVRARLRTAVQHLRDGGATVRVDVDPLDL